MFASVADHLVVPPSGNIVLESVTMELMYLKDLLDKVGVKLGGLAYRGFQDRLRGHGTQLDERRPTSNPASARR